MSHTPTPWKLGAWSGQCKIDHGTTYHPGVKGGCSYTYRFLASEDWEGCISAGDAESHIELIGYDESGPILSRANAAFIVQAVNSYDILVAALTTLSTLGGGRSEGNAIAQDALRKVTP